jgi:hypothetical protein
MMTDITAEYTAPSMVPCSAVTVADTTHMASRMNRDVDPSSGLRRALGTAEKRKDENHDQHQDKERPKRHLSTSVNVVRVTRRRLYERVHGVLHVASGFPFLGMRPPVRVSVLSRQGCPRPVGRENRDRDNNPVDLFADRPVTLVEGDRAEPQAAHERERRNDAADENSDAAATARHPWAHTGPPRSTYNMTIPTATVTRIDTSVRCVHLSVFLRSSICSDWFCEISCIERAMLRTASAIIAIFVASGACSKP